jgi:hypothetical protein
LITCVRERRDTGSFWTPLEALLAQMSGSRRTVHKPIGSEEVNPFLENEHDDASFLSDPGFMRLSY